MPVLIVNGADLTPLIGAGGVKWSRNDLDHSSTGRTLDGVMHRKRTTYKIKLSVSLRRMTDSDMQSLNEVLLPETVEVTYSDPIHGETTRTFYGSSISSTIQMVVDGQTYWDGTQFDLTEV